MKNTVIKSAFVLPEWVQSRLFSNIKQHTHQTHILVNTNDLFDANSWSLGQYETNNIHKKIWLHKKERLLRTVLPNVYRIPSRFSIKIWGWPTTSAVEGSEKKWNKLNLLTLWQGTWKCMVVTLQMFGQSSETERDQQQSTEPNIGWLCDLAKMLIHSNLYYEYENSKRVWVHVSVCVCMPICMHACMCVCPDITVPVDWA